VTPQQLHLQRNNYFQKVKNKFSKSTPSVNLTNENNTILNQAVMSLNKIEYNNTNSIFSNSSSSGGDAINSNNNTKRSSTKNKMNSINDKEIGN
jgi:hypothetical protein